MGKSRLPIALKNVKGLLSAAEFAALTILVAEWWNVRLNGPQIKRSERGFTADVIDQEIRPGSAAHPNRWTRSASFFDKHAPSTGARKIVRKLYRRTLPPAYRHMALSGPRFTLRDHPENPGRKEVYWENKYVTTTLPYGDIRDSKHGECFIVATGPSLNQLDLTALKGRAVFGVNGAIAKLREAGVTPDHHAIFDPDFIENRFPMVEQVLASGCNCFFSRHSLGRICEFDPALLQSSPIYLGEQINRIYGTARVGIDEFLAWARKDEDVVLHETVQAHRHHIRVGFCKNLEKGIFTSCTITLCAIQIAYFLGYRRILLLGMDLDYRGPNPRFYEKTSQMRPTNIDRDYEPVIRPAFEVVRSIRDREPFEVYNLSPTSRLPAEIIPRKTLAEALGSAALTNVSRKDAVADKICP